MKRVLLYISSIDLKLIINTIRSCGLFFRTDTKELNRYICASCWSTYFWWLEQTPWHNRISGIWINLDFPIKIISNVYAWLLVPVSDSNQWLIVEPNCLISAHSDSRSTNHKMSQTGITNYLSFITDQCKSDLDLFSAQH